MTPRLHAGGHRLAVVRRAMLEAAASAGRWPICGRCREYIDPRLSGLHPLGLTVGHILAQANGGSDQLTNLQPEHRRCNLEAKRRPIPAAAAEITSPIFSGESRGGRRVPPRGMVPGSDISRADIPDRDR